MAYFICRRPFYKADKFTICQFSHISINRQWLNPDASATIGVAIAMTALIFAPGIPGTMKPVLGSVYYALSSAMACRVYRALLLGTLIDPQPTKIVSFYGAAGNIRDHDASSHDSTLSRRSSKLAIDVGVEMHPWGDTVEYAL
jgi:hypothetical protein